MKCAPSHITACPHRGRGYKVTSAALGRRLCCAACGKRLRPREAPPDQALAILARSHHSARSSGRKGLQPRSSGVLCSHNKTTIPPSTSPGFPRPGLASRRGVFPCAPAALIDNSRCGRLAGRDGDVRSEASPRPPQAKVIRRYYLKPRTSVSASTPGRGKRGFKCLQEPNGRW